MAVNRKRVTALALLLLLTTACSSVPERRLPPEPEPAPAQASTGSASAQASPGTAPPASPAPPSTAPTSPAPAPPAPAPQRPTLTTIRVLAVGQQPVFDLVVPAFHERYKQYRVEVVTPPPARRLVDQAWLRQAVSAGEIDLLIFWQSDMSFLVKENLLTPLDPLIRKTGFDLAPPRG